MPLTKRPGRAAVDQVAEGWDAVERISHMGPRINYDAYPQSENVEDRRGEPPVLGLPRWNHLGEILQSRMGALTPGFSRVPGPNNLAKDAGIDDIKRVGMKNDGAIALTRRAAGGPVPAFARHQQMHKSGPLRSPVAGRTDHLPISVKSGSHVLPADIVSALGEGNTEAGFRKLEKIFPAAAPRMPKMKGFAEGGDVEEEPPVDILAAGGEHVLDPEQVIEIGGGDPKRGHAILDAFIKLVRAETIKTLRKLPGPARK